ncbi:MAG: hypothetical protein IPL27_02375 [Lewinellaceae bacterium]|nr:hypothetical protein [Lewinellaceae bacterium]
MKNQLLRFQSAPNWLFVFLFGLLFPHFLLAQFPGAGQMNAAQTNIGRFYGKVVDDATGKGIGYASVQLIGMRFDSVSRSMQPAMLAGQLTQDNGEFSLENLPILVNLL